MASLTEKYPLEKTKPLKKTISGMGVFILIILIFCVPFLFGILKSIKDTSSPISFIGVVLILFGVLFLFVILKYIYEVFYLKYYEYDLEDKNLRIKKGVFSRNEITLPINRLQDVYVDQDVLDRIFGLYDVHVSSATMISGNLSHIDGLNKQNSEAIKNLILSGIHKENE